MYTPGRCDLAARTDAMLPQIALKRDDLELYWGNCASTLYYVDGTGLYLLFYRTRGRRAKSSRVLLPMMFFLPMCRLT